QSNYYSLEPRNLAKLRFQDDLFHPSYGHKSRNHQRKQWRFMAAIIKGDWIMQKTAFCLGLLMFASLARAQVASLPQGQATELSCERFLPTTDDKYYLENVRSFLALAQRDFSMSAADQAVQNMGDGVSIAVLKIATPSDLMKPDFMKAYLLLARTAFAQPKLTFCAQDKSPEVTLFLLGYLR